MIAAVGSLALSASTAFAAPPELWQVPETGPASGAGAGEMNGPLGVAVDQQSGHVYVADSNNSRIEEFTAWGEFVKAFGWKVDASNPEEKLQVCTAATGCQAGTEGAGPGQFKRPEGLAVDSGGNLYVVDIHNHRVQKFDSAGNFVLTFGGEVNQTTNANLCTAASGDVCGVGKVGTANGQFAQWPTLAIGAQLVAVGPGDAVYVGDENRIQVFDPGGTYQSQVALPKEGEVPGGAPEGKGQTEAIAVDPTGNLYFDFNQSYSKGVFEAERPNIYKHTGSGWSLFAQTPFPKALATDSAGHLYAVDTPYIPVSGFPLPQRVVEYDGSATPLIPDEAETEAESYFAQKAGFQIPGLAVSEACGLEGPDVLASYRNPGLATNQLAAYGPTPDPGICPPPVRPPSINDQFAASVDESSATLRARISSRFWPSTTYYVEYGTEPCGPGGCASKPAPPGIKLNSKTNVAVLTGGVILTGLAPGTTYHYRFVAKTLFEPGPGGEAEVKGIGGKVGEDGEEGEFTTPEAPLPGQSCANQAFRTGLSAFLPDCRAYEMVSPVDKEGADIVALINVTGFRAGHFQSAGSGDRFTYSAYRPFDDPESSPYTSQYVAARQAGMSWTSESISPPRGLPLLEPGFTADSEFKTFDEELCQGWLRLDFEQSEPPLDPAAPVGFSNLFQRHNCAPGAGAYEALTRVQPPDAKRVTYSKLELQGTSADGAESIFVAPGKLTADAPEQPASCVEKLVGCQQRLYHFSTGGQLRYVCFLPNGTAINAECSAGNSPNTGGQGRKNQLTGAISADGSRVFFASGGALYVRLNADQEPTVSGKCEEVEPNAACTIAVPGAGTFWAAAADGSRVIYANATGALREYDVEENVTNPIAASGTIGVLGQSEDAKRVYFASSAVLAGPNGEGKSPTAGEANLYFHEVGQANRFIVTLTAADVGAEVGTGEAAAVTPEPIYRASRVSGDGLGAAFLSTGALTGYDNTDQVSGAKDQEVFHYDAAAEEGEGRLACPSCDPSGARPVGRNVGSAGTPIWQAAAIPTWEGDLYASRPLSEDGKRLFFNSFVALVARDTNGREDVYEWEAAASRQACEALGAERYIAAAAGCLSLISSGESPQDSEFIDADPSGEDVFFATGQSLLPQDPDLIDIYDARAGGGLPVPAGAGTECEGQACQNPTSPPAETTPSSSSYRGPGNVQEPPPKTCPKGKHRAKKNGKVRCAKNRKKQTRRHKKQSKTKGGRGR